MSAGRFVVGEDGLTVTDTQTGLTWSRKDIREGDVDFTEAESAVTELNAQNFAGHSDWRLPTVHELFALVDVTRTGPAIDVEAFPTCARDWYWTGTPYAWSPSACAWAVGFYRGGAGNSHRGYFCRVRAVRGSSRQ
jgi:hypothetical protein